MTISCAPMPSVAMVLAAGLGYRMRPITLTRPKPLVAIAGRTMLDRALDRITEVGIPRAVVNIHYLGEQIRAHLAARTEGPQTTISDESDELLETGGGVRKALPLLGEDPFVVANSDILWTDAPGAVPALCRMAEAWDPAKMDALLLLHPVDRAHGYDGAGDFFLDPDGRPRRRGKAPAAPFLFSGVEIITPQAFADTPEGPFSLNLIFDRLLAAGRLFALVHDGEWFHVGTPDALAPTEAAVNALGGDALAVEATP